MGFANMTTSYYKYVLINSTYTYTVTVTPIIGNPALFIKLSNTPAYPVANDIQTYNFKADSPDLTKEVITITYQQRLNYNSDCDKATYSSYNGQQYCVMYIGVACTANCIYNITVNLTDFNNSGVVTPPKYLIENDFYYGSVKYDNYSYFYLPIHRNNTGDMAILVNKTSPTGSTGDA